MNKAKRNRPADNGATPKIQGGESDPIIVDKSTNGAGSSDHRALIDHVHILVLESETPVGIRARRATYFSLRTAQRALDRATMRRQKASLILCRLVPVDGGSDIG